MQCCLKSQEQHYIGSLLVQCHLEPIVQQCTGFLSVPRVSPAQEKHFTGKTLCSVVFEAPDNIGKEKILFNVVLIFLGEPMRR